MLPRCPHTQASDAEPATSVKIPGESQCVVHPSVRSSDSIPCTVTNHPLVGALSQIPRMLPIAVVAGSSENQTLPFHCARTPAPPTQTFVAEVPRTPRSAAPNRVDCVHVLPFQCLTKPPSSTAQTSVAEVPQMSVTLNPLSVDSCCQFDPS